MSAKEVFDFSSEMHCSFDMVSLEEMLFNELKEEQLSDNYQNMLRWDEFRDISFDCFNNSKSFRPENNFILQFINRLGKFSLL